MHSAFRQIGSLVVGGCLLIACGGAADDAATQVHGAGGGSLGGATGVGGFGLGVGGKTSAGGAAHAGSAGTSTAAGGHSGKGGTAGSTGAGGKGAGAGGKGGSAGSSNPGAGGNGTSHGGNSASQGGNSASQGGSTSQGGAGGTAGSGVGASGGTSSLGGAPAGGSAGMGHGPGPGPGGAGGDCGSITLGDPTCDACIGSSCCAEDKACTEDAECAAILTCVLQCPDQTCAQNCVNAHPGGFNDAQAFFQCLGGPCNSQCGGGGGTGGGGGAPTCDHDVCAEGGPLTTSCTTCTATVCANDPYCCQAAWDSSCTQEAQGECGAPCGITTGMGGAGGGGPCGAGTCDGCCTSDGNCTGVSDSQCGYHGALCVDCTLQGSFCSGSGTSGQCEACTPSCKGKACGDSDGCGSVCSGPCDAPAFCLIGSDKHANGCVACGPDTCDGCCDDSGQCQGPSRTTCVSGGGKCQDCGAGACVVTEQFNGTNVILVSMCGACGQSCPPNFPGEPPQCAADGCGGLCPGASCPTFGGSGQSTCQVTKTGAQCVPQGFCDPFQCASGCCDYSGGFFGATCAPGNLPSKCGTGGTTCVDCISKGTTCDAAAQHCAGCTPSCDATYSCGQSDGCGGVCTLATGGKCSGVPGQTCNDKGQCVCPDGQSACADAMSNYSCIPSDADPANCGGCGVTCPAGVACVGGQCECAVGSHYCPGAKAGDAGVCTNLATDDAHCGDCSITCPGTTCTHGQCGSCPMGKLGCTNPPGCVDAQNDAANCGGCGVACPAGVACVGGMCDCPGGTKACSGQCLDVSSDPKNCGACFSSCPTGVACKGGMCDCPGGTTFCGGQCTNPQVDPNNCGMCGTSCFGKPCINGKCL